MSFSQLVFRFILIPAVRLYLYISHGAHIAHFDLERGKPCLILSNHVCFADPAFVQISFKHPLGFLTMSEFLGTGAVRALRRFVSIIPIEKGTLDLKAVRACIRFVQGGRPLVIFPEGVRTPDGTAQHINPSIIKLIRLLKAPVIYYNIKGGFGADPKFGGSFRRGRVEAGVAAVRQTDEISAMTDEELYEDIVSSLSVTDVPSKYRFKNKRRAEYLERLLYICPACGAIGGLSTKGDKITCRCGMSAQYGEDLLFRSGDASFPYACVSDWYAAQKQWTGSFSPADGSAIFSDSGVSLFSVSAPGVSSLEATGAMTLTRDSLSVGERIFPLSGIDNMVPIGRQDIRMYYGGRAYKLCGRVGFCSVKYMDMFAHLKGR